MKIKLIFVVLGFMAILLIVGMVGGCGERFYDEINYEYPNWTPEGLIYCQKAVTHYRREPMGTMKVEMEFGNVKVNKGIKEVGVHG